MKRINPICKAGATVRIPGSKSITHRAIIAAGLADGTSVLRNFLECEDTLYTMGALREMGAGTVIEGTDLVIEGTGAEFKAIPERKTLALGNSGTSLRLLLSVVALCRGEFLITGTERMLSRPVGPLVLALNQLGVDATCVKGNGCPPVLMKAGGMAGGTVKMKGDQSSQFLSSLLLSGPYAHRDVEIRITGELVSRPYVDITCDVMERFGVHVERDGYTRFRVPSGTTYMARDLTVQGDASSASYFWAAAAVTGGTVTTENIDPFATSQGDIQFLEVLEQMGCVVDRGADRVVVHGGALTGIEVDMGHTPDLVPTLAAMALFAEGKTIIRNVPHLRHKESDRLRAVALEWARLGGKVGELSDGLIIHGGTPLSGSVVHPHDDHRLAMSLAVVGLRVPGIVIKNNACVNKSFPAFWYLWDRLC
ncbi:MAG: 3-phosphoshikimate 1-carboxyvinyltransferase [Deltaproteobacteria bacterium]|nr:3-phosphoshikimate 1-carboxyvinyltransferase [Deltaproteobacteria bacterium]MBW2049805.1 3-phosphoshikimate 1-carboxyvinyltransferase [Deltaproteobacteria bacterium]MBW2111804.1 3-phosphoshikimate 1-carboxyvinyltransferase [Deltaproteobacteria bacterium]